MRHTNPERERGLFDRIEFRDGLTDRSLLAEDRLLTFDPGEARKSKAHAHFARARLSQLNRGTTPPRGGTRLTLSPYIK
jgi:hypothetical protein